MKGGNEREGCHYNIFKVKTQLGLGKEWSIRSWLQGNSGRNVAEEWNHLDLVY